MPQQIETIEEFVGLVELRDLYVFEERARRKEVEPPTDGEEVEPEVNSALGVADAVWGDSAAIGFRFRMVFDTRAGAEFVADMEARYTLPEGCSVTEGVKEEFATRVAFMTVYPYLRASIQTMAMRLGVPAPVLGIVRQGELQVGEKFGSERVAEMFPAEDAEKEIHH
ncbi:hypothetical protein [Curtobacterium flaccumfaciens]|uniref:hypothetical protein n=1 Tax=Curtobacterium flaccumfaciens TaxID=2035 RepID=UPI00341E37EE